MTCPPVHALLTLAAFVAATPAVAADFDRVFDDATLRVDFYQLGNRSEEHVALDRLIRQGRWAGPDRNLIDPQPYCRYFARLRNRDGAVLYQTGFDSIFGEYRVTAPARDGVVRVYHESILLPFQKRAVRLEIGVRRAGDAGEVLLETTIDPDSPVIADEPLVPGTVVIEGHIAGDPHRCLDIAFVGEGYTAAETEVFEVDVERFTSLVLSQQPYASMKDRINIRGVMLPSAESGVDEPTKGVWRRSALSASFFSLGSPRYLLTEDNRSLRDIAAVVPYDTLAIMVNHSRYGGGGIFNRFCTFTTRGAFSDYLLLHEFGHSFGGLADEYYTSATAYEDFYPQGEEPISPNITAMIDPDALKWRDLVDDGTALPTEWDKAVYDRDDLAYQAERRALNAEIAAAVRSHAPQAKIEELEHSEEGHALARAAAVDEFMKASGLLGVVGAFEGAGYVSTGLYRPEIDCLMFSRGLKPLCSVCRRAVAERITYYTGE